MEREGVRITLIAPEGVGGFRAGAPAVIAADSAHLIVHTNLSEIIERNIRNVSLALCDAAVKIFNGLPQGIEFKQSLNGDSANSEPVHISVVATLLRPYIRIVS